MLCYQAFLPAARLVWKHLHSTFKQASVLYEDISCHDSYFIGTNWLAYFLYYTDCSSRDTVFISWTTFRKEQEMNQLITPHYYLSSYKVCLQEHKCLIYLI
jgi:hypothetical protein